MNAARQNKLGSHDIAYACFAFSGSVALFMGIISLVPMDPAMAGGIGILIGVPLSVAALVSMCIGLVYSIVFYKHWPFVVLSITTIAFVFEIVGEFGTIEIYNFSPIIYGIVTLIFAVLWVAKLRKGCD